MLCQPGSQGRETCNRECKVVVNARRGRPTPDFDLNCETKDGTKRWLNITAMFKSSFSENGEIVHLFRDVTERRSVENAVMSQRSTEQSAGSEPSLPKPSPHVVLSRREDQVLRLLAVGKSTVEIADTLQVKRVTARNHITRLMNKLGASTRLQAVVIGARNDLI